MFMWLVTSSNPSHDVITVDNKSSNLSSHTFKFCIKNEFRSINSFDQKLANLVLPSKLKPQVFEFSFQVYFTASNY